MILLMFLMINIKVFEVQMNIVKESFYLQNYKCVQMIIFSFFAIFLIMCQFIEQFFVVQLNQQKVFLKTQIDRCQSYYQFFQNPPWISISSQFFIQYIKQLNQYKIQNRFKLHIIFGFAFFFIIQPKFNKKINIQFPIMFSVYWKQIDRFIINNNVYNFMIKNIIILLTIFQVFRFQICYLPLNETNDCPNLDVCTGFTIIQSQQNANYSQCSNLTLNFDTVNLISGIYGSVYIFAQNIVVSNITVYSNISLIYNSTINMSGVIQIGECIIIFANSSEASSTIDNLNLMSQQFLIYSYESITINNSVIQTNQTYCTYTWNLLQQIANKSFLQFVYDEIDNILIPFVDINVTDQIDMQNITLQQYVNQALDNFSIILINNNTIQLINTTVITSKYFSVSNNFLVDINSVIDSSYRGCNNNFGAGKGLNVVSINNCNSSGASSSGYGGLGMSTNLSACYNDIQYFLFLQHCLPYGLQQQPLVSGSSGANPNNSSNQVSSGGGIVIIQVASLATLDGQIQANGQYTNISGNSAGSGGSINIFTFDLNGEGNLSVAGGASYTYDGQGSGGWVKLSTLNQNNFSGIINVSNGYRTYQLDDPKYLADKGNLLISDCPTGEYLNASICIQCPSKSYKGILYQDCQPCPPLTNIQFSNTSGNTFLYECYSKSIDISKKYSFKQFITKIQILRVIIFIGLVIIFSGIGLIIRKKYKKKKNRIDAEGFDFQKATQDINQRKIITQKLKQQKEFKMADLLYHMHRICVLGTNIYDNPWILNLDPPEQIISLIISDIYIKFGQNFNEIVKWTKKEKIILYMSFLVYPLYWYLLIKYKKQKFKKVCKFVELLEVNGCNFINKNQHQDKNLIKIKVSKNTDYTKCYIDIFKYQSADLKYFILSCPYIVYLSGEGNFIRPFYLCSSDPFLNALFLIINRNLEQKIVEVYQRSQFVGNLVNKKKRQQNSSKLNKFMRQFNRCSCILDLSSPDKDFIEGMVNLIQYIKKWNEQFFINFSVKINLFLIIIKFEDNKIIDHQVIILENNDSDIFNKYMRYALEGLKLVDKYDIKFALHIYNPHQHIDDFSQEVIEKSESKISINESIQSPLVIKQSIVQQQKKSLKFNFWRTLGFIRYYFISHRKSDLDRYLLQFLQITLILVDASFVIIWQNWKTYPYIGIDFISPFIGIIWISSNNSYGIGKVFLILNAMSFFNDIILMITCLVNWNQSYYTFKIVRLIGILLQFSITYFGCKMLTYSKKLNTPTVF